MGSREKDVLKAFKILLLFAVCTLSPSENGQEKARGQHGDPVPEVTKGRLEKA